MIKNCYRYYLNRGIREYERMRNLNGIMIKDIITNNLNKLTEIFGQFYTCIAQIDTDLSTAFINKSNDNKCKLKRIALDESLLK